MVLVSIQMRELNVRLYSITGVSLELWLLHNTYRDHGEPVICRHCVLPSTSSIYVSPDEDLIYACAHPMIVCAAEEVFSVFACIYCLQKPQCPVKVSWFSVVLTLIHESLHFGARIAIDYWG